jgi:hypothetical protein
LYRTRRQSLIVNDTSQSQLSDRLPVNTLSFNINNRTAYSFREAPLQIILYSGSEVIYVKDYTINNFYSKERKDITISLIGSLPNVTRIDIVPEINILDPETYLKN